MSAKASGLSGLDFLTTELATDSSEMLDRMSVADLVSRMNSLDAEVAGAVRTQLDDISSAVEATSLRMSQGGRLIYVGAGTSGRLGVLDASEIPPTFGVAPGVVLGLIAGGPDAIVSSVEAAEDDVDSGHTDIDKVKLGQLDTVIGVSSSGRTPYVLEALTRARELGALTVALSCNAGAPISAVAEHPIEVVVGPEIIAGSTRLRAGTATKMVLNMFSTIAMIHLGKTYGSLMVDVRASNAKLRRRAVHIVTTVTGVDDGKAERTLRGADWNAKLAIAMIQTRHSAKITRRALQEANGRLRDVLEVG